MDDLARRLRDAGTALQDLRGALVAGEPWPLSDDYGHTPESQWGPPEILGHVDEMLPYWTDELERVRAGDGSSPVPFGRMATDQSRMDRIDADRRKPMAVLLDDVAAGVARASAFAAGLDDAAAARIGVHPSRGEITIADSIERFLTAHLEDHLAQLREILARSAAG